MTFTAFAFCARADFTNTIKNHFSESGISSEELGVIVNDNDPVSIKIAEYYKVKRRIPEANVIHLRFTPGNPILSRTEFQKVKTVVDAATPRQVQAYVLTWTLPYRVECMSMTSAFAFGFDEQFCSKSCGATKPSPYFNSRSKRPYDDYQMRPTMVLAGQSFDEVKNLIDRGVISDGTFPHAIGYLVSTSDKLRNTRAEFYPEIIERYFGSSLDLRLIKADYLENRSNVLFYFTGTAYVKALDTIRFSPGAIADHLTSVGGDLSGRGAQMSTLRWITAGATGSYGTVVEPCNYPAKFPHPGIVIDRYFRGETLIEAYWKSVAWPGEGIFIGEPLAAPFGHRTVRIIAK